MRPPFDNTKAATATAAAVKNDGGAAITATKTAAIGTTTTTKTATTTATATAVRGERALGGATDHCERGGVSGSDKGRRCRTRCCCCCCWCCCRRTAASTTTTTTTDVGGDTRRQRRKLRYGCAVTTAEAIIKLRTAAASPLTGTKKFIGRRAAKLVARCVVRVCTTTS